MWIKGFKIQKVGSWACQTKTPKFFSAVSVFNEEYMDVLDY